jgi:hypothetical protein
VSEWRVAWIGLRRSIIKKCEGVAHVEKRGSRQRICQKAGLGLARLWSAKRGRAEKREGNSHRWRDPTSWPGEDLFVVILSETPALGACSSHRALPRWRNTACPKTTTPVVHRGIRGRWGQPRCETRLAQGSKRKRKGGHGAAAAEALHNERVRGTHRDTPDSAPVALAVLSRTAAAARTSGAAACGSTRGRRGRMA